jgi:hypothetical protein
MIETMALTNEIKARMTSSVLFPPLSDVWSDLLGWWRKADERPISPTWIVFSSPVEREKSTCQATEVFASRWEVSFTPRTTLGKRLYALRTKAIIAGMKILSEEEVLEEVKRRRGEIENNETNLY